MRYFISYNKLDGSILSITRTIDPNVILQETDILGVIEVRSDDGEKIKEAPSKFKIKTNEQHKNEGVIDSKPSKQ